MSDSADKITIALGAVTQSSVTALVITRGIGGQVPTVTLQPTAGPAKVVICERLTAGPTIRPHLQRAGIDVYRVRARFDGEATLEARNADRTVTCKTSPFRGLPTALAGTPAGMSFVLASCLYHFSPDFQRYAASVRIPYGHGPAPSFAMLAGDNVYLDVPKPSGQSAGDVVHRYLKYFLDDGYMRARAALPSFTTYDDHEYWNDYPERSVPVDLWLSHNESAVFGSAARECLDLFQRSINPPPLAAGELAYQFDVSPVSFFVIDTRSQRAAVGGARIPDSQLEPFERALKADHHGQLMPERDLIALKHWAAQLQGPGILVLGQPLWIEPVMKVASVAGDHNVSFFRRQYRQICRALEDAPFDVLVCSGDVHYSRLLRIETKRRRVLRELVSSPLVSIPTTGDTLRQYVFGGAPYPAFGTTITDATRPPMEGWRASYQTGTGKGSVYAVINLKLAGAGVSVGFSFIDLRTGTAAELMPDSSLGRAAYLGEAKRGTCFHPAAFTLGKKLI